MLEGGTLSFRIFLHEVTCLSQNIFKFVLTNIVIGVESHVRQKGRSVAAVNSHLPLSPTSVNPVAQLLCAFS